MDLLTNQTVFFDNNKLLSILQQMSTQIKEQGERIEQLERECATKKEVEKLRHCSNCSGKESAEVASVSTSDDAQPPPPSSSCQIDTNPLKPAAQSAEMVVKESPVAQEAEESSKPAVGRRRKPTLVNASVSQFDRQHQTSQLDMPQRLEAAFSKVQQRLAGQKMVLLPMRAARLWECLQAEDGSLLLPSTVEALVTEFEAKKLVGLEWYCLDDSGSSEDGQSSANSKKDLYVIAMEGVNVVEVQCNICMDTRADVRLSGCDHTLCRGCLVAMRQQLVYSSDSQVRCPFCRGSVTQFFNLQETLEYEQAKLLLERAPASNGPPHAHQTMLGKQPQNRGSGGGILPAPLGGKGTILGGSGSGKNTAIGGKGVGGILGGKGNCPTGRGGGDNRSGGNTNRRGRKR